VLKYIQAYCHNASLSENEKTVVYEVRASYLDELSIGVFKAKSDRKIEIVDFQINCVEIYSSLLS
jgi:hypothetical protein